MRNLSNILLPVALLCVLGALGSAAFWFFAVIAASFGFERPFYYFQYLRLPLWAVALPVSGMLALLPLALRLAFAPADSAEKRKATEPGDRRRGAKEGRDRYRLRPV